MKYSVLILASGRGERLKPLTNHIPKALCLIHGKPLIQYHIEQLIQADIDEVMINHAYLGDQIKRYLQTTHTDLHIKYLPEPPGGLESLGGICNALYHCNSDFILTINADIYTEFKFSSLLSQPFTPTHAHLLLVPLKPLHAHADFGCSTDGFISNTNRQYIFSGIALYPSSFFKTMGIQRTSISPLLRQWADEKKLKGSVFFEPWYDIGTVERLRLAEQEI